MLENVRILKEMFGWMYANNMVAMRKVMAITNKPSVLGNEVAWQGRVVRPPWAAKSIF